MASSTMTFKRLREIAEEILENAKKNAEAKGVPTYYKATSADLSLNYQRSFAESIDIKKLEHGNCWCARGAILSYDLRRSSTLAVSLGPKNTYIAMHTYIGTVTALLNFMGGTSFGLRGDGAIHGFIAKIIKNKDEQCQDDLLKRWFSYACICGEGIVRTIDSVVRPILNKKEIVPHNELFQVGVGVDTGFFVVTRMGHETVSELTAYGECVNRACKSLSQGNQSVYIHKNSRYLFPTDKDGKAQLLDVPKKDALKVFYPADHQIIPEE